MRLFIAEKPSLGKAISDVIGNGVRKQGYIQHQNDIVTWCFGHILELKEPHEYNAKYEKWILDDLPIEPSKFEIKPKKDTIKQFYLIKELLESVDVNEVVNAGDPDREGQLLIDEILEFCNCKKTTKRILISDLNEKNIRKALNSLEDNEKFKKLYYAAQSRSFADWLYGINLTRFYTLKAQEKNFKGVLSIGRVQTPILGLVVNRYLENKNHKAIQYFVLKILVEHENQKIEFTLQTENMITQKEEILEILSLMKNNKLEIESIDVKTKKTPPPLPFSLIQLQKTAAQKFGYSPDKILTIVQELYESHKLLTYPRSDCSFLPEEHFSEREIIIENLKNTIQNEKIINDIDIHIRSKAWNDKKVTAHHAIIPTSKLADLKILSKEQQNIYTLVAYQYLLQFTKEYIYNSTVIIGKIGELIFKTTGTEIIEIGWRKYEKEKEEDRILPTLIEGLQLPLVDKNIETKKTTPNPLFTDSSLLEAISKIAKYVKNKNLAKILKDTDGLGTPATQADIIKKLFDRNFVKKEKTKIIPTQLGLDFIKALPQYLVVPDTTAYWEMQLSEIEEGKLEKEKFWADLKKQIGIIIKTERKTILDIKGAKLLKCPLCGDNTIQKGKINYYCSSDQCKFLLWETICSKKLTEKQVNSLLNGKKIGPIKGLKNKKEVSFEALLFLDKDGKIKFEFPKRKK